MKKYISVFIITALLMTTFVGFRGTALAQGEATISLNPNSVSVNSGDSVNIIASVTNNTGDSFTDCHVKVGGTTSFGEGPLGSGETREIPISFAVSDGMLNTDLSFKVEYKNAANGDSWVSGDSTSLRINKKELVAAIKCTATASQTLVAVDDEVVFSFAIENQGEAPLENIEVKADKLNKGKALNTKFSLQPGKSFTVTYKHKFTSPITVAPYINYTVSGSSTVQKYSDIAPIELKEEERKVTATLSADNKTPDPGQKVTFTLKLTNDGNVPYTNLSVAWNGQELGKISKLDQGQTIEKDYELSFDVSADVKFTVTLKDQKGQTKPVNTNTVQILLPIDTNALQSGLKLVIEADRNELTSAGVVNFSGYISNDSVYDLSEVSIKEASLGEVFAVSEMAQGTKQSITATADINETTTYNFTLSVKDRNGQEYTVTSDPITVTIQGADETTADPSSDAPDVTLPPDSAASDPLGIWFIIAGVLVVLIIGVGAALIVLWRKGRSPSRVSSARSVSPRPKKPTGRGGYSKPVKSRSYRDRNNF